VKALSQHARYAGVGLQFAGTFLLTGWLGWWLDGKLGTSPWLLLVGIFFGAAGGFYSLVCRLSSPQTTRDSDQSTPPDSA
jgi:F0F1-type ATP synthase assembly protein I